MLITKLAFAFKPSACPVTFSPSVQTLSDFIESVQLASQVCLKFGIIWEGKNTDIWFSL